MAIMDQRNSLEWRQLGSGGLRVSALGLGCMSLSGVYGESKDEEAVALVRHALDQGMILLDSADMYGWGQNEELVGRAIAGRRDEVVLATKFGQVRSETGQGVNGRPDYVHQACEASLKRLKVDVIDLYYQHRVDPKVPIEDTVGAMADLVQQGKVRYLGLSEARPETIRRAHRVHPIAAVQTEFSLLYREEAEETLRTTRELGIGFVAYSPLGRGFLAGGIHTPDAIKGDRRAHHPRFQAEHFAHNRALVDRVEVLARDKGCTPAQLVLAWLLAQGLDVVPIPGTKHRDRLDENLGALNVHLSANDITRIAEAVPIGAAAGTRYPDMAGVYR
jgi:aryl-alcohol dehydrogenase-like predicted oxidoreductase